MFPNPYALADKTIKKLNRSAMRRFQDAKSAMLIPGFDELTVIKQCKVLYERLKKDNSAAFYDLYAARYLEIYGAERRETSSAKSAEKRRKLDNRLEELAELYLSGQLPIGSAKKQNLTEKQRKALNGIYETAQAQVDGLLSEPNPVTGYSYKNEIPRKKERCEESVNAAQGTSKKKSELDKALRFWSQMTGQYTDAVSDMANVEALKDAGVKYVRWTTQQDEKVCKTCDDRDGKIYRIDRIPDKPHWRCRCWTSPVSKNGDNSTSQF